MKEAASLLNYFSLGYVRLFVCLGYMSVCGGVEGCLHQGQSTYIQFQQMPEEGTGSPGTGISDSYWPTFWSLEIESKSSE